MPHMLRLVIARATRAISFRGKDEQVPPDPRCQNLLRGEWEPFPEWVFIQGKVGDFHSNVAEFGKHSPGFLFAESEGDRAFRPISAVMDKILRSQIAPTLFEKIMVVNLPYSAILVAAQTGWRLTSDQIPILLPASSTRHDIK
jgi:hypothetical protein